jgi:leucyl-tRNA synthetase
MAQTIELAQVCSGYILLKLSSRSLQTVKRDYLKSLEKKYQSRWQSEKLFEVEAPPAQEIAGLSAAEIKERYPKWFGNFPYPYMNGSLHLGHAFTISKIEFAAGYQRMLGKRVLFPHGFHVTGLPIKVRLPSLPIVFCLLMSHLQASADKLIREMDMFGSNFERYEDEVEIEQNKEDEKAASVPDKDKTIAKKGKLAAKSTGLTYQFQILEAIGIPRSEIKKFADPQHWLAYFPPIAMVSHTFCCCRLIVFTTLERINWLPFLHALPPWFPVSSLTPS